MGRLLLVRHAQAGERRLGPADVDRPLDARGVAQAEALAVLLAPLLDAEAATPHVLSSPAARCRTTVAPLAAALRVPVAVDDTLWEGSDVTVLHARLAGLTGPTVWCSHGDVIPGLLTMLARRGVDLGANPRCQKASTWVLDVGNGTGLVTENGTEDVGFLVTARYLPPPD